MSLVDDIKNGKMDGEIVFICDIRDNGNPFEKFIRNIRPTKVMVMPASECKKTIYYSQSYFAPLLKNGNPSKKIIALYDNTGYRSYEGYPLNVFDNLDECEKTYGQQCLKIENNMVSFIDKFQQKLDGFSDDYAKYISNTLTNTHGK